MMYFSPSSGFVSKKPGLRLVVAGEIAQSLALIDSPALFSEKEKLHVL